MKYFWLLLLCCTTMGGAFAQGNFNKVRNAPLDAGERRDFPAPFQTVVKYTEEAMREAGLQIEAVEQINAETTMLIGQSPISEFSWGEMVRSLVIAGDDPLQSTVRVYTRKKVKINLTAKGDYSKTIFNSIAFKIEVDLSTGSYEAPREEISIFEANEKMTRSEVKTEPAKTFTKLEVPKETSDKPKLALVIGNAAYQTAPLRNPVNDANAISAELRNAGFEVLRFTNLKRVEMRNAIRSFGDRLLENRGVGLFYFAGHGMQYKGRNYLIPVDADIQKEYDIEDQAVAADMVLQMMELYQNSVNIVILDACRNNPYSRGFRSADRGLAPIAISPTGSIIAFSTAPGQTASDGDGRNGLFTQELIKSMKKEGLSLEEVFKDVRINVARLSDEAQIPWTNSSLMGDFYFKP